jgi:valyl-tRNA synthetase
MSKSLGTGIDPLEAVAQHGADATRYGLLKISSTQDVRFSWGAIEEGASSRTSSGTRRGCSSYAEGSEPECGPGLRGALDPGAARRRPRAVDDALGSFEFFRAVDALYHVTFDDFCDWYLEAIKPRLRDGDEDARATALAALERLLALLHRSCRT